MLYIPQTRQPTWKNGFARSASESTHSELWPTAGEIWSPGLGPTGTTLHGVIGKKNGTLTGTAPTFAVSGGRYALSLPGTDEYVTLGATEPNLTGEMSISLWFNSAVITEQDNGAGLFSDFDAGSNSQFSFEINRTAKRLTSLANGASVALTSNTDLVADTWYHVVLTRSGSSGDWTHTIYLDGKDDGSATTANNPHAHQGTSIGRQGTWGASSLFNGFIDDVFVYKDRVLSPTEALTLKQIGRGGILQLKPLVLGRAAAAAGGILPQVTSAYHRINA